ncbi:MAG: S8 family serine peptidase [Gemmataceae bacterium]
MSPRDTSRRRLGLESLEDRTALTAGLTAAVQLGEVAAPMQIQYQTPALAAVAGDPRYAEQWALKNTGQVGGKVGADIGASRAWDVTRGSTRITVSVMDTGVDYTHEDLYQNIWLNQGEIPAAIKARLIDTDGDKLFTFRDLNDKRNQGAGKSTDLNRNGYIDAGDLLRPVGQGGWEDNLSNNGDGYVDDLVGWDFLDNDNDPMDSHGHGTHIAGTIGAAGDNDVGVAGINWVSQLMAIRFVDGSGGGSIGAFITGLNYAVARGAKVSNNSWTGPTASDMLTNAVNNARANGHVVVAAAGNAALNLDSAPSYPASFTQDNVVAVASTDRNDKLSSYSSYGPRTVDIAAPGGDILSTKLGGGYYFNSGTSMATPHVAGAIALVWAKDPSASYSTVIGQVLKGADRLPTLSGKVATGRLNVGAAIGAASASATAPRVINAVNLGNSASSMETVRLTFDRTMAASSFAPSDVTLTGPDGKPIAVTKVAVATGYASQVFDVTFAKQTKGGTYTLKVGPDVKDNAGNQMAAYTKAFTLKAAVVTPPVVVSAPKAVNAVNLGNSTSSMSTIRVSFDRVMSASSFAPSDVTLTGPDGKPIVITKVSPAAGYGDRVFDITFAKQTKGGTYAVKVGPDVKDTAGNQMVAYTKTFTLVQAPSPAPLAVSRTYTSTASVAVPPRGRGVSLIVVNDEATIADVNVELNITHPHTSDLYIHLQAPDGTNIVLVNRKGGSSANFVKTKLDDSAGSPVGFSKGPFTGTYTPDVPLSVLNGKAAKGAWKLWVVDRAGVNRGTIDGWSMTIKAK